MLNIGERYKYWVIIGLGEKIKGKTYYKSKCICGNIKDVRGIGKNLSSKSCGCIRTDINIGEKINRWTIINYPKRFKNLTFIDVQCNCGARKFIDLRTLINGSSKSCGCLNLESVRDRAIKNKKLFKAQLSYRNGITTRTYRRFSQIKLRCNNINDPSYINYGMRGIQCKYENFEDFIKKEYLNYCKSLIKYFKFQKTEYKKIHFDRINNDGNYEHGNVRFIHQRENNINTRHQDINYQSIQIHMKYKELIPYLIRDNIVGDEILKYINGLK